MKTLKTFIFVLFLILGVAICTKQSKADPTCKEETSEEQTTGQLEIKTDVPKFLKGATITVRTADGRESTVSADKFKVVPRKQQFITTKTQQNKVLSCVDNAPRRNRLSILGGHGAQEGLKVDNSQAPGLTTVESKVGAVGGVQYQFLLPLLDDRLSVGGEAQTNKTFSLSVGVDF